MQQRKELHSLALSHFDHKIFEFIRLFNGQKPPDAEESKTNTNRRSKRARGNSKSKYSVSVSSSDKIVSYSSFTIGYYVLTRLHFAYSLW